jgi:hypothetical protein
MKGQPMLQLEFTTFRFVKIEKHRLDKKAKLPGSNMQNNDK